MNRELWNILKINQGVAPPPHFTSSFCCGWNSFFNPLDTHTQSYHVFRHERICEYKFGAPRRTGIQYTHTHTHLHKYHSFLRSSSLRRSALQEEICEGEGEKNNKIHFSCIFGIWIIGCVVFCLFGWQFSLGKIATTTIIIIFYVHHVANRYLVFVLSYQTKYKIKIYFW